MTEEKLAYVQRQVLQLCEIADEFERVLHNLNCQLACLKGDVGAVEDGDDN